MIRKLIILFAKKRNPDFELDSNVTTSILIGLLFELCICFFRSFKVLFYFKIPIFLFLGRGVKIHGPSRIKLGKWVKLNDFVYLSGLGEEGISFGDHVSIGAFSRIVVSTTYNQIGRYIKIGNNVGIGEFAYLGGGGGLEIGDGCIVGQYLSCHPENHNYAHSDLDIRFQGVTRVGIRIGRNCWIGSKVTILDGVTIGDGCVIAAGSVVNSDMPNNSIIAGVPAKVLKSRVH